MEVEQPGKTLEQLAAEGWSPVPQSSSSSADAQPPMTIMGGRYQIDPRLVQGATDIEREDAARAERAANLPADLASRLPRPLQSPVATGLALVEPAVQVYGALEGGAGLINATRMAREALTSGPLAKATAAVQQGGIKTILRWFGGLKGRVAADTYDLIASALQDGASAEDAVATATKSARIPAIGPARNFETPPSKVGQPPLGNVQQWGPEAEAAAPTVVRQPPLGNVQQWGPEAEATAPKVGRPPLGNVQQWGPEATAEAVTTPSTAMPTTARVAPGGNLPSAAELRTQIPQVTPREVTLINRLIDSKVARTPQDAIDLVVSMREKGQSVEQALSNLTQLLNSPSFQKVR